LKIHTLEIKQRFNCPIEKVFQFFSSPENLAVITPEKMGFRIMTPTPIIMNEGRLIDYTVKVLGIRVRWRSLVTSYQTPHEFTDEQILGPYSFWHHRHKFEEVKEGTLMTDTVTYAMPLGLLGRFMHWLTVRRQLDNIFNYRKEKLERIFSK
tara:strand:- start:50 stop:505 length:456 start_codon:yes stop_codon:yes gene_type:complete